MRTGWSGPLEKIDDYRWRIPQSYDPGMRVPGMIIADESLLKDVLRDQSLQQVANVAHLPGIQQYSLAMPDIHWGYGAPIGGVAAMDANDGVISPGMVGYDINCGVRLMHTNLHIEDVQPKLKTLIATLFNEVPCGVGRRGDIRVGREDATQLLVRGARWAVEHGYGVPDDVECTEAGGALEGADPEAVSARAYQRGANQLGTLGSGNHFLEVQAVDQTFSDAAKEAFDLELGQVTVMIHSGSRGFGYQNCDDYLKV